MNSADAAANPEPRAGSDAVIAEARSGEADLVVGAAQGKLTLSNKIPMNPIVKIILNLGCAFGVGYLTAVWVHSSDRHENRPMSVARHEGTKSAPAFSEGSLRSSRDRERDRPGVRSTGSSSEEILEALFKKRLAEVLSASGRSSRLFETPGIPQLLDGVVELE